MVSNSLQFRARKDAIIIRGVHDVAIDTSSETRNLEGKLDAHVNLVTQLPVNQKYASIARVCVICSSNDHHINVCPSLQQSRVNKHPESYAANNRGQALGRKNGLHDVATYIYPETSKLEGKLDALVNLVTHLAVNQKSASVTRVYDIHSSNDHHTDVYLSLQGVHDVATDISIETRKLEGKLDALVNLVTQLVENWKFASIARAAKARHIIEKMASNSQQFSARNDVIVIRGVHDVATDTSAKTRKLEDKIDAPVNMVTHLVVNEKSTSVARQTTTTVETKHLIEKMVSNSLPFSARNDAIVIRGIHDVATNTFAETRMLERKLNALVNLVSQLAVNQKSTSVARVSGNRSSNEQHTNQTTTVAEARHLIEKMASNSQQFSAWNDVIVIRGVHVLTTTTIESRHFIEKKASNSQQFSSRNNAIVIRGVHDVAIDTSADTRKLEDKLDAHVNLFSARNDVDVIVIRGVHDVATYTSPETRKLEGKLDALVNLVTQLDANQKYAYITRVCSILSSNDHHINVNPFLQQSVVNKNPDSYAVNI
ncbi:hypothetical protein Fmac_008352 [Flemingia macrophylla]|uniref:Uncharacterized protein n=1 Tax=Flemingia macrophylla TaxID=520843 RepID=A0ABD1MY03_9FABA